MLYQVKTSGHAEERRKERVPHVNRDTLSGITQQVKRLGLDSGVYHVPVRSKGVIQGYAVYRGQGKRPVGLVTVYGKNMRPPGPNLETSLKTAGLGDTTNTWSQPPYTPNDQPKPSQSDPVLVPGSDQSHDDLLNYVWGHATDGTLNGAPLNSSMDSSAGPGYLKTAARLSARRFYGV